MDREETEKYFYVNKDSNLKGGPNIPAAAYLVGDLNTGEVILAKIKTRNSPRFSLQTHDGLGNQRNIQGRCSGRGKQGSIRDARQNGGLRIGEKIKILDLLYPLLLESSNDAAEIIAGHFERDTF